MHIEIDYPAAWFLLPLDDRVVQDPDEDDDPPRYERPVDGGWQRVGEAVLQLFEQAQPHIGDPFLRSLKLEIDAHLTPEQEWTVDTWFSSASAPQLDVAATNWTDGRHRSWSLGSAGFEFAPVLLIPFGDAIHFWESDQDDWPPLDDEAVRSQRNHVHDWHQSSWSKVNPQLEPRWSNALDRWEIRLSGTATYG